MAVKLFAQELEAYSDADLDRYLEETGRLVSVHDPKNLSEHFIQRLRDRAHTSDKTKSLPVDLAQVSAQLLQVGAKQVAGPPANDHRLPSESPTLPSPEEQHIEYLEFERECYEKLVADGGRPWYPVHLLEAVSKNPREYRELLWFWQGDFPDTNQDVWWCVFANQLGRWEQFREWQGRMRKAHEDDPPKHTELSKKQLARHLFTKTFAFNEDPKRQDKLTEWIEYMSYEYTEYHKHSWYKRRERWYNKAWQKLVDSQVLRPNETMEFILSDECEWQRRSEGTLAQQAAESAKTMVSLAQQAVDDPSHTSDSAQRRLAAAQSKLDSMTQSLASCKRRNDLIIKFNNNTFNYREAKRSAERHEVLLQWIRDQVPLIEQELKQTGVAESSVRSGQDRGVKRYREHQSREEHSTKKQKCDGEEPSPTSATRTTLGCDVPGTHSKHKVSSGDATSIGESTERLSNSAAKTVQIHDITGSVPQQFRHSARIAARSDPARNASASPRAAKRSGPNSRQKSAQAPNPPSTTGSQTSRSSPLKGKTAMGSATRRGGQPEAFKSTGAQKRRRRG